jgi:hypothetical protein
MRYAIGLAGIPHELVGALEHLTFDPKPAYPVRVIACREPLRAALQHWQSRAQDSQVCEWVVSKPATTACPWSFEILNGVGTNPLPGFADCVFDHHLRALDQHLRTDGGLLVAQFDSDAEERAICRKLLRHCSGLLTYLPSNSPLPQVTPPRTLG